jgi:hypothetical protein
MALGKRRSYLETSNNFFKIIGDFISGGLAGV